MAAEGGEPDIMTWFPRREDYEDAPQILVDETIQEKISRLNETIEINQGNIKEIVDGNEVDNEQKIYRTMDLIQDMEDLQNLLKVKRFLLEVCVNIPKDH